MTLLLKKKLIDNCFIRMAGLTPFSRRARKEEAILVKPIDRNLFYKNGWIHFSASLQNGPE